MIIVAVCRVHGAPGPEPGYVPAGHDDDVGAVPLDEGEEGHQEDAGLVHGTNRRRGGKGKREEREGRK